MTRWESLRLAVVGGAVPEVEAGELHRLLQEAAPPLVLDVRTALEFRASRIPGAIHAPRLEDIEVPAGREVVAICLSAHRSIPAVHVLTARGAKAAQLRGGMLAWWRAGLPTESGR